MAISYLSRKPTKAYVDALIAGFAGGGFQMFKRRTAGNITLSSATTPFAELDSTNLDMNIPAVAGDVLEFNCNLRCSTNNTSDAAFSIKLVESGNYINGNISVMSWYCPNPGGSGIVSSIGISGPVRYTVQAGDVDSGRVLCRPVYNAFGGRAAVLDATSDHPAEFSVKNLGPVTI